MKVIAEGVEEYSQLNFLRRSDCDVIQVYYTGRPALADVIQDMLMGKTYSASHQ